jgi:hypothetical protein
VKGFAPAAALAAALGCSDEAAAEGLARLAADGLAEERSIGAREGWLPTPAGVERHASDLAAASARDPGRSTALADAYGRFLACNGTVKGLCARWQLVTGDAERFELLDELAGVHEAVEPALAEAAAAAGRFGRYASRLTEALARAADDPRYVVSSQVDSYHQVWFECHEDFLLSLGRDRADEGSF